MNKKETSFSLFTASFKQGFTPANIPMITIHQGDKEFILVLDSGSEYNVINKEVLNNIDYTAFENDGSMPTTLSGIGGKQDVSACTIKFKCNGEEYIENFVVNDFTDSIKMMKTETGIIIHGILGSLFMRKNHIVLDYQNLMAYSKK